MESGKALKAMDSQASILLPIFFGDDAGMIEDVHANHRAYPMPRQLLVELIVRDRSSSAIAAMNVITPDHHARTSLKWYSIGMRKRPPRKGDRGMPVDFILLDTSVLSEARKTAEELNENIVAFLRSIPTGAVAVPPAAIFELRRGALILSKTDAVRGRALGRWLDQLLETDIWLPPVNVEVRRVVAMMSVTPELESFWVSTSGTPKMRFGCDPEIAATAIVHGLPIASTDVSDYMKINRHFPLPGLYCPLRSNWHILPPAGWRMRDDVGPPDRDWRRVIGPIDWSIGENDDDDDTASYRS